jgi:predicted dehydrogenase
MILCSIQAGKPVLAEKPLARTLAEGTQLVEAVIRYDIKVGVNYQYRYDSGCYALARAVQCGAIGRVHSMRINVPWHRTRDYFERAAWHRTIAQAGGGTLITQGSHFLDVALWALGEAPVSAVGYTTQPGFDVEVETLAHGIVETSGGTLVSITSTLAAATEQAVKIEAYGSGGTAVYSNRPVPHVKFSGVSVRRERLPVWGLHALHRSLAGFAKWILEDQPFLIPAASSLPVLAAVEAIYRSSQEGQRIKLDHFGAPVNSKEQEA